MGFSGLGDDGVAGASGSVRAETDVFGY